MIEQQSTLQLEQITVAESEINKRFYENYSQQLIVK